MTSFNSLELSHFVQDLSIPPSLTLLSSVLRTPYLFPSASYKYLGGVPSGDSRYDEILEDGTTSTQTASTLIYLREMMVVTPREKNGIADRLDVQRSLLDLNARFNNFAELSLWGAISGRLHLEYPDVTTDIDYHFRDTHRPSVALNWASTPYQRIKDEVLFWKSGIATDAHLLPNQVYTTEQVINTIFDADTDRDISDRHRDQYYGTGSITGLWDMNWKKIASVFQTDEENIKPFISDGAFFMGDYTTNTPIELLSGPSYDFEAPANYVGKFAKAWTADEKTQALLEWVFVPVITRPDQMMACKDVFTAST